MTGIEKKREKERERDPVRSCHKLGIIIGFKQGKAGLKSEDN